MIKKFNRNHSLIVLYKEDWKILFQDRKNMSKGWEEYWFFGWWVDKWESFEQAVIRETEEELNIKLKPSDITLACNFAKTINWYGTSENHVFIAPYKQEYDNTIKILEWERWVWWTLNEVKKQVFFNHDYMVFGMLELYFDKYWFSSK